MAGKYNWTAIEPRYKGGEPPEKLAAAFKVPVETLYNKASKLGWVAEKREIREIVAQTLPQAIAAKVIARQLDYVTQHTDDWQSIRQPIMDLLAADLILMSEEAADALKAKASFAIAAAKAYKDVQVGQRLSLGLDKPAVIVPTKDPDGHAEPIPDDLDAAGYDRLYQDEVKASQGDR